MVRTEEELKAQYGSHSSQRSESFTNRATQISCDETDRLQELVSQNFYSPQKTDLIAAIPALDSLYEQTAVLVPCYEPDIESKDAVIATAKVLSSQLGPENVYYIIAGIHNETLAELQKLHVRIIYEDKIRSEHCDWRKLASLLGYDSNYADTLGSKLRGKGVTVLFGLAGMHLYFPEVFAQKQWLVLSDAEIASFESYQMLPHLLYPVAITQTCAQPHTLKQLVLAKVGRGNEHMCMAVNMLHQQMHCSTLPHEIRNAAKFIFKAIAPMVWYGSGERAIAMSEILNIPIGAGYNLEVVFDMALPFATKDGSGLEVFQVGQTSNPHPRLDGSNSDLKEWIMWSQIGKTLHTLALNGIILPGLSSAEDYINLNGRVLESATTPTIMLPQEYAKPVQTFAAELPRIFPPVNLLIKENVFS